MNTALIHLIAAAWPNFMKIAPLYHALVREPWCRPAIVQTGQHYDANMSDAFFRDLRLPDPVFHLEVGSGTHAEQTGRVMIEYEKVAMCERPDRIVVVGDVNSTAACAMVGTKLWISVIHLRRGCAAVTAVCRRKSIGSSPTPSVTCCGRRRRTPTKTLRAKAYRPRGSIASATS
jgi:UDP-N-acetylglucosamine 2-epimerase (non-hydrolysing)